ncbi:WhiB family redox-sensing transcriptional regulator [Sediminihabitans luteus]|uniref:WhiB family redox-sensing transcriptional regulator n=1 Tax=Sediminihabitans luteus TaxID=1138585 RepID=A0A2M9CZV1_9CELL|nr:WhiB family transcriptional regulator [Sediminihabitans luteus]PJJ77471.1 WhiB family redox-sensing transcriptional regulator [Sediminihabitans luteus]GII98365.1 transcriptional regulator WhiB [Sediminihabitans luteus]
MIPRYTARPTTSSAPSTREPEDWRMEAACLGVDPESVGFHDDGLRGTAKERQVAAAKALCATCDVATACLEFALAAEGRANSGRYGIFGGLDGDERGLLSQQRRAARTTAVAS